MALKQSDKNDMKYDEATIEFEPDFEVVQMPVEKLDEIGVEEVERVPEVEADKSYIQIRQKREGTRNIFSLLFLAGFLLLLLIGMILGFFMDGNQLDNTKEVMLTISGILSGPLGFVVGYYFRRNEE